MAQHAQAPERRLAQRRLAQELTELVHGRQAWATADAAASVLFGGDPLAAGVEALEAVRREVPSSTVRRDALDDVVALLVRTGLAVSNGEARRSLAQRAITANGRRLEPDDGFDQVGLLHDRFLLLRRGRSTYHLVEVVPERVDDHQARR